jgi:hypothetical protein
MEKNCILQYGNDWLLTDDLQTEIKHVGDRCVASRHTEEWAKQFQVQQLRCGHNYYILTTEAAAKNAERERDQKLRSTYFYAFDAEVRRLAPDEDFYIKGVGCSAVCFGFEPYFFAQKMTAKEAAKDWLAKRRQTKKKKTPKTPKKGA